MLGRRLAESLHADFYACKGRLAEIVATAWREYAEIVCIMAAGIVVRTIAPLLQDKYRDPAIVVCDEQGRFAVSLLSGHLGGANDLAHRVAAVNGGQAVLTTASDVLGRSALDLWCRDLDMTPGDKTAFTKAMGRLVDHGLLTIWSRYPLPDLPPDLKPVEDRGSAELIIESRTNDAVHAALLHPKALVVGIGCNRGTSAAAIAHAVAESCRQHQLAPQAIARLASIDLKQDEAGLLEFAHQQNMVIDFFRKDELNRVEGVSTSAAVQKATGAKGVAEPAALLSAGSSSTLLVTKMKWTDVTTAIAEIADPWGKEKMC
jgi:cobalt-precorrin 5A hydrolase